MYESVATITGNLSREPELRYTPSGVAVASFSLAVNYRRKNKTTDEWDEQTSFFDVTAWNQLAENVAETLDKGMRVVVVGRLEQQTWKSPEGENRHKVVIIADEVAPSLRWATCQVQRTERGESASAAPSRKPAPTYSEEPF